MRLLSPITAAGPSRISTGFPIIPNLEHLNRVNIFIEIDKKSQEKFKFYIAVYGMGICLLSHSAGTPAGIREILINPFFKTRNIKSKKTYLEWIKRSGRRSCPVSSRACLILSSPKKLRDIVQTERLRFITPYRPSKCFLENH